MTAFPDWQQFVVPQRHPDTGCIPWSYEILLRAARVAGIDFTTFQEDFDLDRSRPAGMDPRNDFGSVAQAVQAKYPFIRFARQEFATGGKKLAFIEEHIAKQQPTVVSVAVLDPNGAHVGWHMMPVVDANDSTFTMLHSVDGTSARVSTMHKAELVRLHNTFPGGKEVAYLET